MKKIKYLIFVIFTISSLAVYSQVELIPVCPSKNVNVYTKNLEDSLHLFSDITSFEKAKFFRQNDSSYLVQIYYLDGGQPYLTQKTISEQELEDIRSKIRTLEESEKNLQESEFYKTGKIRFNIGSSIYSFGGYAWMLPVVTDAEDIWLGVYVITGAAGFVIPMWLTHKTDISRSDALYKNYGQFKGFADGMLFYTLIDKKIENKNHLLLSSMSFSILEGTAGYFISRKAHFSYLNALTSRTYSLYGYYWGGMLGLMSYDKKLLSCRFPTLVSGFVGAAGGYFLSKKFKFTRGDNRILFGTTYMTNSWALAINTMAYDSLKVMLDFDRVGVSPLYLGAASLGILSGTVLGIKNNLTASQAVVTNLSTVGTGLIASGLVYVFSQTNDYNRIIKNATWANAVTSTIAFSLLYANYSIKNQKKSLVIDNKPYNVNFALNPSALFVANNGFDNKTVAKNYLNYKPVFSLNITF